MAIAGGRDKSRIDLKPALSLVTHVAYVKELPAGREISYGGTYTTSKKQRIATIPVGYADGYARGLSNRADVLIHGRRAPTCRQGLYGSVYGGCHGHPADGDGR